MINLPDCFKEEMKELLCDEYDSFIDSYNDSVKTGLRLNRKKLDKPLWNKIDPFQCQNIEWIDNGFFYDTKYIPSKHPYYYAGLYYLQEPSAMTPANRLPINTNDKVLDLCAAPGGKSTEILSRLGKDGLLVSNDISATRAKGLLKNLELFGCDRCLVLSAAPDELSVHFPEYFDKILVDAPCSGEGMFRKRPSMLNDWADYGPEYYAKMQRTILPEAYKMLKPGGMMMFSTCTFSTIEDEANVEWLLNNYSDLSLEDINEYSGFSHGYSEKTKKCIRIFPHKMPGEGHFIALFRKNGNSHCKTNIAYNKNSINKPIKAVLESDAFSILDEVHIEKDIEHLEYNDGYLSYLNEQSLPSLKGLHILRRGLLLGSIKNKRFSPSQALSMCLDSTKYEKVMNFSTDDENVIRYLKGETIVCDEKLKGYVLICIDGFSLGWGKADRGKLKNKYLPGWRLQ